MPIDHSKNTMNGNQLNKIANTKWSSIQGRTSNLPIYEIRIGDLIASGLGGPKLLDIVKSMTKNRKKENADYIRATDYDDRQGNMPVAPAGKLEYREYSVPGNKFPEKSYVRLVSDMKNKRLYITPTHYDTWLVDSNDAQGQGGNNVVANNARGAANPFFLLAGVGAYNSLFY